MDLDEQEVQAQSAGDANLMKILPSENDALSTGLVALFTLNDGKSIKALFDFMTAYPEFTIEFHPEGLQIQETLIDSKTGQIDMASYMIFKGKDLVKYIFCPQNLPTGTSQDSVSIKVSAQTFYTYVKKNKATTVINVEYNIRNPKLSVSVTNGSTTTPFYLDFRVVPKAICQIPPRLLDPNIKTECRFTSELLSANMAIVSSKHMNILYDFNIAIFKEGFYVCSDASGVGGISCGKTEGSSYRFALKNAVGKRLTKLCKISPRSTVSFIALDSSLFKITCPTGSYGVMFIFQYPKMESQILSNYQQLAYNQTQIPKQINYTQQSSQQQYQQQQLIPVQYNGQTYQVTPQQYQQYMYQMQNQKIQNQTGAIGTAMTSLSNSLNSAQQPAQNQTVPIKSSTNEIKPQTFIPPSITEVQNNLSAISISK